MKKFRAMDRNDQIFVVLNTVFLVAVFIITLYPMVYVLSASFSDPKAVASGEMLLFPVRASIQAYEYILNYKEIWTGYANTIFYTVLGTILNLVVTLPCAYVLSRKDMPARNFIMMLFLITMYFGGGMIPTYLNFREFGLLDTRWVLLVNGLVSTYNMIVCRSFFVSVPYELHEAAVIDGCDDFRIFTKIILPLSLPIVVVMMIYYGVSHWNSYFNAMIYIRNRDLYPLQVFLKEILTQGQFAEQAMMGGGLSSAEMQALIKMAETADMIKYGVIVVSTVPMLIVYPMIQKHFEKGVMIGAVKG